MTIAACVHEYAFMYMEGSNMFVCVCDAMCCSVLQCVTVCCSVLQCVAVCCSVSK